MKNKLCLLCEHWFLKSELDWSSCYYEGDSPSVKITCGCNKNKWKLEDSCSYDSTHLNGKEIAKEILKAKECKLYREPE